MPAFIYIDAFRIATNQETSVVKLLSNSEFIGLAAAPPVKPFLVASAICFETRKIMVNRRGHQTRQQKTAIPA